MTPAVATQGDADPVSKPGLPRSCCAEELETVSVTGVLWMTLPPVPVTVIV